MFVYMALVWCLVVWLTFNSESCVSSVSGLDLSLLVPFHHEPINLRKLGGGTVRNRAGWRANRFQLASPTTFNVVDP